VLVKGSQVKGDKRDELREKIRMDYESGASIRQIAASLDRSYGFVHRLLREARVELRRRGGTGGPRRSGPVKRQKST
jgi:DNA-directed RNA polymerase specialized sigma24 family protein